jgi:hypothetical protein
VAAAVERIPRSFIHEGFVKELIVALAMDSRGFITQSTETMSVNSPGAYKRKWNTYKLAACGQTSLILSKSSSCPVIALPVPQVLRDIEEEKKQKARAIVAELQGHGVDTAQICEEELHAHGEEGATVRMHLAWARSMASKRLQGRHEEAERAEEVLALVLQWRDAKAVELGMAPAGVMGEHVAKKIVHTKSYSPQSLRDAGLRLMGLESLSEAISGLLAEQGVTSAPEGASLGTAISLPEGIWTPPRPSPHVLYKPGAKGKPPMWKEVAVRFGSGESMASIAMSPPSGRGAVQVPTVAGHLLTSLLHGEGLDLQRFFQELARAEGPIAGQLTTEDVSDFESAAVLLNWDCDSEEFMKKPMNDICRILPPRLLGDVNVDHEFNERSPHEKAILNVCYSKIKIWKHLAAAGFWNKRRPNTSIDMPSSYKRNRLE